MQAGEVQTYRLRTYQKIAERLGAFLGNTDRVCVLALVGIGLVAAGVQFNDQFIGPTGDNAEYMLLGVSLATGQPYANAEYPWGYPALIAPFVAIAGPDNRLAVIPWLKLLSIFLFAASIPLIYFVLRKRGSPILAFVATALFAINSTTLAYANDIMTEIPYVCASFGALLLWQRRIEPWLENSEPAPIPSATLLTAALLIAVPYYLRTVGLTLMAAASLTCLVYRKVRAGLVLGVLLALMALPWLAFSSTVGQDNYLSKLLLRDPYSPAAGSISSVPEFVGRGIEGANLYINTVFPTMVLPGSALDPVRSLVGPFLAMLMLVGLALSLVRKRRITEIYVLLFVAVICVWPWKADRFLLPVYPLLVYYVLEALRSGGQLLRARLARPEILKAIAVAAVILLALPNLWLAEIAGAQNISYWQGRGSASGQTPDWQAYFAASAWLKANTPPGSVSISRKSTITEVFADRPSVLIPLISPDKYPAFLKENHVAYVVEDAFSWSTQTGQYLRPAIKANPKLFRLLKIIGPAPTRIWQVVGGQ